MKKIVSGILLLGLIMSLSACGGETITMQDVYDAHQLDAMLASHESVSLRQVGDGELYEESYMNKEIGYENYGAWAMYMSDHSYYFCENGVYSRVIYIEKDGLADIAGLRASFFGSPALSSVSVKEEIQSVTTKEDQITVATEMPKAKIDELGEEGMTAARFEYVLDAKTHNPVLTKSHYEYDDGTDFDLDIEFTYDAQMPEGAKAFVDLEQQTENLRAVTIVSLSGAEKETTSVVQVPKGVAIALTSVYGSIDEFEIYADAACKEPYVSGDYSADTTIYIKWIA